MDYSVLMSVYYKEKPEWLRQAMDSMWAQTVPTNDFVLVCDGLLNEGLRPSVLQFPADKAERNAQMKRVYK